MKTTYDLRSPSRPSLSGAATETLRLAPRTPYPERGFGIGYGRSSGYAPRRRYSEDRAAPLFRCG